MTLWALDKFIKKLEKDIKNNERFEDKSYAEMLRNSDRRYYLKFIKSLCEKE
jgi:hypothetical protein